ncbi:hypothetical protein CFIMG_008320RA00001 [Ceratocystis fimbriata CBS 114723]|uniref:FAR1 domain-containing protein n=1 Tax=Ceratocystis fimbriata CBS 114723 TaxID=1035309 RepID=A0A2C5X519_9PEZI|nr:hypothetical protein CFIMG_008320RA00001 [Ceratocystis fimbriata CBS 114723]
MPSSVPLRTLLPRPKPPAAPPSSESIASPVRPANSFIDTFAESSTIHPTNSPPNPHIFLSTNPPTSPCGNPSEAPSEDSSENPSADPSTAPLTNPPTSPTNPANPADPAGPAVIFEPPPQVEYTTKQDLLAGINRWASERGYGFVTGRVNKNVHGKSTITYTCDRYGPPQFRSINRRRITNTRKTGCRYYVLGKETNHGTWLVQHASNSTSCVHNHPPTPKKCHPQHRYFTSDDKDLLKCLVNAGVKPNCIVDVLQQRGNSVFIHRDVYNEVDKIRASGNHDNDPTQAVSKKSKSSHKRVPRVGGKTGRFQPQQRKCTKCNSTGHSSRSKACPARPQATKEAVAELESCGNEGGDGE